MDQEALLVGKATDQHPEKRTVSTISCILASQALEKLAYYGLVPNMILYLTVEYGMGTTEAANILFLWSAATNFFPLIGAFIADSYTGRFPLIGFGSSTSLLGMLSLWLAAMIQPKCDKSIDVCQPTTPFQLLLLYSFFTLTSIGAGGVRSSCLAFAADQLQLNSTTRISTTALETLFNWYYFSVMLAYFHSESLLVFVQTKYGWQIGFGVSLAVMALSVAMFFVASPFYVKFKCGPSLVSGLFQVLVAAFRNQHVDLASEEHVISYHHETGPSFSIPSQKLRYLNKACATSNPRQDLTLTGNSQNPWKLCTVQQVEDFKSLVNVLPIWSTGIILSLVTACQASFIVLQAKAMDRRTFIKGFEIPPGCYGVFMIISFVVFLVIYDIVVVPLVSWALRKPRLGVMVRMGAGIAISVLCISTLAIVEYVRRKRAREEGGTMLSAMWLLPYMLLGGISEALISIAQNEFFYSELPKSMSSVATTLSGLNMAAASLVSSWIVTAVDTATCRSWITEDINEGHLDYYYWLMTAFSLLNVVYFVWCSKAYGKCKTPFSLTRSVKKTKPANAMAMALRLYLLLLVFLSSAIVSFSLYEDQVGLMDWHQRYIGKVKHAVFHTQKTGRKRVIVSTEENVVASLDLRHGEIFWRHVLGTKDAIDGVDIALGKYVITLSSEGSMVRAWNLPDGQMVWETSLHSAQHSKSLLSVPVNLKVDKDYPILVFGGGYLHAVSPIDGEVLWKKDFTAEGFEVQRVLQPLESSIIYVLGFLHSSEAIVYQIDSKSGEVVAEKSKAFPGGFSGEVASVSNDKVVVLDSTRSILVTISFVDEEISFQKTLISDLVEDSGEAEILSPLLSNMLAVKVNKRTIFVRVGDQGKLEMVDSLSDETAMSDSLPVADDQVAFASVHHEGSKIHLTVKLVDDLDTVLLRESIQMDQHRGRVDKVFINNYIKTDRSNGFRALIVMEDHSLLLLQQGAIVWSREEGLASVTDVTTAELPVEKDGVSVAKVEHTLVDWLKGHILKLKGSLLLASPEDVVAIQEMRMKSSGRSKLTRDHNGFRKLFIALTRAGKLYALHTGDGRIVWSTLLKSPACARPSGISLYQWQVPHHHAMDENPSVLVVGRCGSDSSSPGVLSFVDVYTGKEISSSDIGHSVVQVMPLPFTDSTEQRLHLIADTDGHVHLYPKTSEALSIFQREFQNVYWYNVEGDDGIVRGHGMKSSCSGETADEYCFTTRELWTVVFPSESEKIISTLTRKPNEVVHTQAKVSTDQDVLYKYVSRNLLFVATVSPKGAGEIGSVTPEESALVVYLIDTVTGRILHRLSHQGCQGPVHAVFSENWVVYHYFNLRAHKYEVTVVEIYDQSRAENKNVWKLVLGKHNLTAPISSYSRPEMFTKSQSYFFPQSVKTIAVTSTAKGITSKQLLIGTIGDQILALDKRFVDPRRTLNPSQAEKEEGIIPLTDSLPIIPQSYITHSLKVEGLRGIVTAPAKLESTTHVFAYGVDLFYTRLAPSKTYDSLTDDFSYALLLITIVALVAAIYITWALSEKKELSEKWR
ncbi:unnamed protein product [Brassica rapa subsp. trilocularis]